MTTLSRSRLLAAAGLALGGSLGFTGRLGPTTAEGPRAFTNFETEPVRPLALAPGGDRLYAVNTADDRLEIFDVTASGLVRAGEVGVGLRPVAVAAGPGGRVWVVNHLSDSVSVVDAADPSRARVVATVPVGDEPRDVVVAGPNRDRVFVASAYRGDYFTPGAGRASVWVMDAAAPERPPREIRLSGDKPRALAASADGRTVYAAVFHSGNGTTVIGEADVEAGGGPPPPSPRNTTGQAPPMAGLVVRLDGTRWVDEAGRDWSRAVKFDLPDSDVFVIDAAAEAPAATGAVAGVGTTIFNLAVRPGTGEVWATNTEARNAVRFEPNLRGHTIENRVTRLSPVGGGWDVTPVHLNGHIDYRESPGPADEVARSLAQPTDLAFTADGGRAYVAAFGSRKVGVLDGEGRVVDRIDVGFGPGGLALDERHGRLYVLNHLEASISVVDLAAHGAGAAGAVTRMPLRYDPTPAVVHAGRPLLYDAALTSGHGDMACASCHVFGDMDHLAWDLGDPTGRPLALPAALRNTNLLLTPRRAQFHPMKGPMTTQSLRGMQDAGAMHWRGDRFGSGALALDEVESFKQFNPAFVALNGRADPLTEAELSAYAGFVLTLRYPPNPTQNLDRGMTAEQRAGFEFFSGPTRVDSGVETCEGCHSLPLGTNGRVNFEGDQINQDFKAAHLRNLYDKVGRFDVAGQQVRGYGFVHNGSFDTLVTFLRLDVFDFPGQTETQRDAVRRRVAEYLLAFDTGMAPAVGRQVTLGPAPDPAARAQLDRIAARAAAGDCDLVARRRSGAAERGYLWTAGAFETDRTGEPPLPLDALVALAAGPDGPATFTCVPPGDGRRSALDRDEDGYPDGDEIAAGSDPADPASDPRGAPSPSPSATSGATQAPPSPTATSTLVPPTPVEPTPTGAIPAATATVGTMSFAVWLPVGYRP